MPILLKIIKLLVELLEQTQAKSNFKGEIMYIVKDDNPDVGYSLAFTALDSEGHEVSEEGLVVEFTSDDTDVISIAEGENAMSGTIHFGAPGLANLNVTVKDASDNLIGSFGAQFTVTVGDPASISGGTLAFEGLSEVEPVA